MDLAQLNCFYQVGLLKSFTKASESLFITQPAVSARIKALETEFGVRLIDRSRKELHLTFHGEVLFDEIRNLNAGIDRIRLRMEDLKNLNAGSFRFGTSDIITTYLLPEVLTEFTRTYPNVEVTVIDRMSEQITGMIAGGTLDFGIISLPAESDEIVTRELIELEMIVIAAKNSRFTQENTSVKKLLQKSRHLMFNRGSKTRRQIEDSLQAQNITPDIALELGTCEILKKYVQLDFGISILPSIAVTEQEKNDTFAIYSSAKIIPPKKIGIAYRRQSYRSRFVESFLQVLHKNIRKRADNSGQ